MIFPVLKRSYMRTSNDKLNAIIRRDEILTQVYFTPNSCCFHYNRLLPRCLLLPCNIPNTLYYTSFILSNLVK